MRPGAIWLLLLVLLSFIPRNLPAQVSELKRDEHIVFFPTIGRAIAGGAAYELEIHGCVYELEKRRTALLALRQALKLNDVTMTAAQKATFAERARLFMVDNERRNNIIVGIGNCFFPAGRSGPDGHFSATIRVAGAGLPRQPDGSVEVRAILPRGDARSFTGRITLFEETGTTVISDIDDTVKITEVDDRRAMLLNTFLNPFRPVPGMSELYRQIATNTPINFCYASASPWQLYLPLAHFTASNQFPSGAFLLRKFRWKDESLFHLFEQPAVHKRSVIEPLLRSFPKRRFVFIGDSGEQDPEVYAQLAREHPRQVSAILIRNLGAETESAPRYQGLGLPEHCRLLLFRNPAEIGDVSRFCEAAWERN